MSQGFSIGKLTIVTLTGKDRNKIANNLCTQDLRSLADGSVTETFVTDVKGKTLSHGLAIGLLDRLWFISSPGQGNRLVPHFDRYIIREDAAVEDSSSDWNAFLFLDWNSLASRFPVASTLPAIESGLCFSEERDGFVGVAIPVPWVEGGGGLLLLPASIHSESERSDSPWNELRQACVPSDTTRREGWELSRIQAFWPWYGIDCDDRNLPQELDIDTRAISFKKGCYLGQETVARLDALGQVQKKLVPLRIEGSEVIPLPYAIRIDEKEIGSITSIATTTKGDRVSLAMMRRSHFSIGTEFLVGNHKAVVLDR